MNKNLLALTHSNLMAWLTRCSQETVSTDKKLEIIMLSLADMCSALAFGSEEEREAAMEQIQSGG